MIKLSGAGECCVHTLCPHNKISLPTQPPITSSTLSDGLGRRTSRWVFKCLTALITHGHTEITHRCKFFNHLLFFFFFSFNQFYFSKKIPPQICDQHLHSLMAAFFCLACLGPCVRPMFIIIFSNCQFH